MIWNCRVISARSFPLWFVRPAARPRLPPREVLSTFLSSALAKGKLTKGTFRFFQGNMTKLDVLPLGPKRREGPVSEPTFVLPQAHNACPLPCLSAKVRGPSSGTSIPLITWECDFWCLQTWFMNGRLSRAACPRRVWSRIWRDYSSPRDGLTGREGRLFGEDTTIFVRYTNMRLITLDQHGVSAGSTEQVEVCVVEVQCPSIPQKTIPKCPGFRKSDMPAVRDPSLASRCCHCTHDAPWTLR